MSAILLSVQYCFQFLVEYCKDVPQNSQKTREYSQTKKTQYLKMANWPTVEVVTEKAPVFVLKLTR